MKILQTLFILVVVLVLATFASGCANPRPTASSSPSTAASTGTYDPASSDHRPDTLYFRIGGFGGPCHEVEFKQGKLRYRTSGADWRLLTRKSTRTPSTQDWEQFWAAAEQAGVWAWKPRYSTPNAFDGTQWSLTLQHAGKKVASAGNNGYPGGTGPEYPPTSSFAHFLRALQHLTGSEEVQ
jgi:hypothetical protein